MVQAGDEILSEVFEGSPNVIYICGSRKFSSVIKDTVLRETLKGNLVMFPSLLYLDDDTQHEEIMKTHEEVLHRVESSKICVADEILVVAPNGYVGECTQKKIDLAKEIGLEVRLLEGPS